MAKDKTEETTEEDVPVEKKSKNMLMIIIIAILVLIILIGIVVAIFLLGEDDAPAQVANTPQIKEKTINQPKRSSSTSTMDDDRPLSSIGTLYPLDTFTVNLKSDSGRRYLKVTMSLELSTKDLSTELDAKSAVIRDRVIRILTSKTLEEITTSKGKEKLSQQIMDTLNAMISKGSIKGIYFTEFVIQ